MNSSSKRTFAAAALLGCYVLFTGCQNEQAEQSSVKNGNDQGDVQVVDCAKQVWVQHRENVEVLPLTAAPAESVPSGPHGDRTRFSRVEGAAIGVDFHNQLDRKNIKNYLLNGAGLAVADIDENGLPDLFLVSQDGPNRLFLQTEPWTFTDVTKAYGIEDDGHWGSGASFADVDNDGDLDLYICNKGAHDVIYMNNGDGTFDKNVFGSGPAPYRAPTMIAFSDFDSDGDLDAYSTETRLLSMKEMFNYRIELTLDEHGNKVPLQSDHIEMIAGGYAERGNYDHLYENMGSPKPGDVVFKDVTKEAGINVERDLGLAAVWWDYNNDNAPDLYVSNDFHTADHLYRNNRDGTFTEVSGDAFPYTSWFSMGSDFADINNDGWFDYLSTDMSATTHFKQKVQMGAMSDSAWFLDNLEPRQYMRNALHVNTGTGKFIEIAFHAGIDSTDWTWSGVFGDLDNDGFEDAFFTNGVERNLLDSDLGNRMNAARERGAGWDEVQKIFIDSARFPEVNLAFRNKGDLKFENVSKAWGLADASVSHGAVLVDLDRDGDLDLVTNNMNEPVGIYRNNSSDHHAVLISLNGETSNRFGLGARVEAKLADGQTLTRLMTSSRGYMSGVEPVVHFGLGEHEKIAQLKITWPSGQIQSIENVESGFQYLVTEGTEKIATELAADENDIDGSSPLFEFSDDSFGIKFSHCENEYNDFAIQPLLPNRLSRVGPAMAVGDANGDGLPDLYFGAAAGFAPKLFIREQGGTFRHVKLPEVNAARKFEDVAATWLDSDQDGDLDLYVVAGGAEKGDQHDQYLDRLYVNDGSGELALAVDDVLPKLRNSGSCVAPCDFDGDGDVDLFVGSRHVPEQYPTDPESSLLINDGGRFTRVDSPANDAGMVTDATWADLDGDQRLDLVVSTEWGPVKVYRNTEDGLVEFTEDAGLRQLSGWWTCVKAGDFDQDGDVDLIAGNFGTNTKYHVDAEHPATLFASDFGDQGKLQLVEAKYAEGKLLPVRGRSCSTNAMPHLKRLAPSYAAFACKSLQELYTPESLNNAIKLEATTLETTLFLNDGSGRFTAEPLPYLAQISPVMDIAVGDFDGDGVVDAALGQNFNDAQRETGRMNAGLGVILKGSVESGFTQMWPPDSGFYQRTNLRVIEAVDLNQDGSLDLISANNNEKPTIHLGQKR